MELDVWRRLAPLEEGALERWDAWARRGETPKDLERLAREESPALSRFVSLQRELGPKARAKFPDGRLTFATSVGYEQSTAAAVADHRASVFRAAGGVAWDACAGVGGEALALLLSGVPTVASDRSSDALRCAAANAAFARLRGEVSAPFAALRADALRAPIGGAHVLGLFDPDRRAPNGRRLPRPEDWSPPLDALLDAVDRSALAGACFKLAPSREAADAALEWTRARPDRPAVLEWISARGRMRELALWTGALAVGATGPRRRATVLGPDTVTVDGPLDPFDDGESFDGALGDWRGRTLLDADVALWQSELARERAEEADLATVAPAVARSFFVGPPAAPAPPGFRAWDVLDAAPLDRRRVRAALKEHGVGPVTVKTRGGVPDANELASKLRGPSGPPGLLAVTEVGDARGKRQRVVLLLAERAPANE
ncbi:MAG: hypothetical protein AAFU73_08820 [Planctomycetota bacterium]